MPIASSLVFDPKTKTFGIAPDFDATIPFWLTTDPPNQQVTIGAGAQTTSYPMSYRYDGPFRGHYLLYSTDYDDLLVNIVDGRDSYSYTMRGQWVHIQTIASADPGFPAILPEALVLQHRSHISVNFQNLDGINDAHTKFMCQGFAYEPNRIVTDSLRNQVAGTLDRMRYMRPHFATFDDGMVTVVGGTTVRSYLTIDDAGYFEVFKLAAVAYEKGTVTDITAAVARTLLFQIFDYSGRQWTNGNTPDLPYTLIAGSGARPNILPAREMLPPKTQVTVEITNNSVTDVDVYFTFIGRRIFTSGG